MDSQKKKDTKLNTYSVALLISSPSETAPHLPPKPLSRVYPLYRAVSTPCRLAENAKPPDLLRLTPHAEQSLLANSRRDLSAADGDTESPRSRVVDASIRAPLAPS